MPHPACVTPTQAIGRGETVLALSHLISVKNNVNDIWYSQHGAGAFPLDPEARGIIRELHIIAGLIGGNPRGVDLEWDFKPLSAGVVELKQSRGGQVSSPVSVCCFS